MSRYEAKTIKSQNEILEPASTQPLAPRPVINPEHRTDLASLQTSVGNSAFASALSNETETLTLGSIATVSGSGLGLIANALTLQWAFGNMPIVEEFRSRSKEDESGSVSTAQ